MTERLSITQQQFIIYIHQRNGKKVPVICAAHGFQLYGHSQLSFGNSGISVYVSFLFGLVM